MQIRIDQIRDERELLAALREPRPLELGDRGIDALLELLPRLIRRVNGHCGKFTGGDLADKLGKCRSP
jgi:hypothetical protein